MINFIPVYLKVCATCLCAQVQSNMHTKTELYTVFIHKYHHKCEQTHNPNQIFHRAARYHYVSDFCVLLSTAKKQRFLLASVVL